MTTALNGVKTLDFSRVLAGPSCTMLLADLGADVVKVERPETGDDTRAWGPPWAGSDSDRMSAYYLSINRNKRSVTLNLKSPGGQELARQLAGQADILIENFKVGQMKRFGLDYEALSRDNPRLVYCSLTGYGQDGPYARRPGYDYAVQGQSGLMSITGPTEGPPYKVGVAISDVIAGLYAANAIQAALLYRKESGRGQFIDVALLDTQIAALVNVTSNYLISRVSPQRYGNAHANIVPYEAFEAQDGMFILAVGNDGQFRALCDLLNKPEWVSDERFATNPARVTNREALVNALQPILKQKTVETWVNILLETGIPAAPINTIPDVVKDPQVQARGLLQQVTLSNGIEIDMVGPVLQLSETPANVRLPPPQLGEHTEAILKDWLGLDDDAIATYKEQNAL